MGDVGETFKALKEQQKEKRKANTCSSTQMLELEGIPFESKNGGAHLIVEGVDCMIDYWPSTGKWITRKGKRGFGVRKLLAFITQ